MRKTFISLIALVFNVQLVMITPPACSAQNMPPTGILRQTDKRTEDYPAIAERFFRGVYEGDAAVVDELAADDIVASYPIFKTLFNKPAIRGRGEYKRFAEDFSNTWTDRRLTMHEVITAGNEVVLLWSFEARKIGPDDTGHAPAGQKHLWGGITIIRFDDAGKIVAEIGEESDPGPFYRVNAGNSSNSADAKEPKRRDFFLQSHGDYIWVRYFSPWNASPDSASVLMLPGWPAVGEDVLGLGAELSSRGFHVFVLHPRGHGQSFGEASFLNALEDIAVTWENMSSPEIIGASGLNPDKRILLGHSWGGGIALAFAAQEPSVRRVISIAGTDHGSFIRRVDQDTEYGSQIRQFLESTCAPAGPVRFDVETALAELRTNQDRYDLVRIAPKLLDRDILIVGGWDDQQVELEYQVLPFYRALCSGGSKSVCILSFQDDHGFQKVRKDLAEEIYRWIGKVP